VIKRLHAEFVAVVKLPDVHAKFVEQGAEPVGSTPAEFGEYVASQIARLRKIGTAAGIKPESLRSHFRFDPEFLSKRILAYAGMPTIGHPPLSPAAKPHRSCCESSARGRRR
jgi:hypothetical protein